ncbi:oligosaccharide flippase family protein, partial [Candidatus Saccharibacteria bacterium]|nr:oligosaccharide flippase family protein [Candidatus Saccharibacteria bacterium]
MGHLSIIKGISQKKAVRNSAWVLGEKIYQMAINFILLIFTSRYLGPSNFGVLDYGATLTNLFLVFVKLGLDSIISNELIKNREEEGRLLGTAIVMRLASAMLSMAAMGILVFVLKVDSPLIIAT